MCENEQRIFISHSIDDFGSSMVRGFLEYTLSFKYPQKKKSGGVKSGDLGGHAIEPPRPIHFFIKQFKFQK